MRIVKTRHAPGPDEEAHAQNLVLDAARKLGWLAYHTHDSRRSHAGYPDLTLVRGKRLICVEMKAPKGKTTPEQDAWLAALAGAGAECYVWRLADWTSGAIDGVLT